MFSRYIWPVDFGPVRPHRMVSPGDLLRKVPSDTDIWASHCWCHALRSILDSEHPNLGSRISPVYRSAQTSHEVPRWSLIQKLLSKDVLDMQEYKHIGRRHALLPTIKDGVSALLRR